MAVLVTFNLVIVLFDLTYIPLRDFYMHGKIRIGHFKIAWIQSEGISLDLLTSSVSEFITQYDQFKGIAPYRDTQRYLDTVELLKKEIFNSGLNSPKTEAILAHLRQYSNDLIVQNPFQFANKTGNLERIKNKMRKHITNPQDSAKQSFQEFWSQTYLQGKTEQELKFFNNEIKPLIDTNYFRNIDENGYFVDNFIFIDLPFVLIFILEFLTRTWYISRSRFSLTWLDAMLWRWYDLFLLIPWFRWLRIITAILRLDRAKLINLNQVKKQLSQGFVASIAEDLTEVVVVRAIDRVQSVLRQGQIKNFLASREVKPYIDINNIDEISEIIKIFINTTIEQILPKIRPDIEAILKYSLEKVLKQSPVYQGMMFLPGIEELQSNLSQEIIKQIYQVVSDTLQEFIKEDPEFNNLLKNLTINLNKSLGSEIQLTEKIQKVESLFVDMLEEIKINYVQNLSTEDIEAILEETRALRNRERLLPQGK